VRCGDATCGRCGCGCWDADYVVIRQTTHCHVDPFGMRGVWNAQDLESFIAAWQFPTVRTRRMMDIAAMHRTPRIGCLLCAAD
jgi:hypothetical protein